MKISDNNLLPMAELDLIGLKCPMPLLKMQKFISKIKSNTQVKIITNDITTLNDFKVFCLKTGNKLVSQSQVDGVIITIIERR